MASRKMSRFIPGRLEVAVLAVLSFSRHGGGE